MSFKKVVAVMGAATLMTGCASVMTGGSTNVNVAASNGKEVKISVEGQEYTTPAIVQLNKDGNDKFINSVDDACEKQTVVETTVEPWFFGNIILGGLLGSTTDSATEKMWTYDENIVINCN